MKVRLIQLVIGLACTLFFLGIAFYRVQVGAVSAALAAANPAWIVAAMLIYTVNLALRAWRWQAILRPVAAIPYPIVTRALLVGYGLNAVMPARLGELFRAEFFKKTFGLSRVWGLTSIVIERLFDGITVICCLGAGLLFAAAAKPNAGLLVKVLVSGSVLFGAVLLAAFYLSSSMMSRIVGRFPGLSAQMEMVQQGLEILRTWRTLEVIGLTLIIYVPDALSLWFLVKAVGLTLGFFRHAGPPRRSEPEHTRAVGPGLSRHIAIRLCACDRIRRRRSGARHRCGNSRTALPASPPCADRRRHSSSRLGERALYDFGEAAI
jgi:uncharacterized membrane protein YbhN (UPF0104 family)